MKCEVGAACAGDSGAGLIAGAEGRAEQLLESMTDSFAEYKEFVTISFLSGWWEDLFARSLS